jgi:hypothetical protein
MRFTPVLLVLLAALPAARAADADPLQAADERTLKEAKVGGDGPALLAYLRGRVPAEAIKDSVEALIKRLGDDDFLTREKATEELIALGGQAAPLLRLAAKESPDADVEVIRRAEKILKEIDRLAGPAVSLAVVRMLARRNPDDACDVLLDYVPYTDDETVAQEVRRTLTVVGYRNGKPDESLTDALKDEDGRVRSAAAYALVKGGDEAQLKGLKGLLKDADPLVRLRAALAFFDQKDNDSLPALIGVLAELPPEKLWTVEDSLNLVAGEKAPSVALGGDRAARLKCRDAWAAWYAKEGTDVDLKKLDLGQRLKGLTLVADYGRAVNNGTVYEVGPDGTKRWQITGLRYPADAEVAGEDRVVVAEYQRKRVAMMNFKGDVKWEKAVVGLTVGVQVLPNGNTLIATRNQIVEVDADGKDVKTITAPPGGLLAGARKLPDGGYVALSTVGNCMLLDKDGKQTKSFKIPNVSSGIGGARFDVTPAGRILVVQTTANKVVEIDRDGREVWQATVQAPTAVRRLPNGRTLVGSTTTQRVVELDRNGREVWEFKTEGRVMSVRKR